MNIVNPIVRRPGSVTEVDISRLAREIARNLKPLELVLEDQSIDSEQWERIKENDIFSARLAEEAAVWSATTKDNLRHRIATKAAVAVEELMLDAIDMVQDKRIGGEARIKALQFLAKLGQLESSANTSDDGSGRVTINILLGGKKLSFDKDGAGQPTLIEHEPVTPEVSP
jgi:anti-sigma-K factor RskA